MRIWAKAIKGGKIRKQFVYEKEGKDGVFAIFHLSFRNLRHARRAHTRTFENAYLQFREIQSREFSSTRFRGKFPLRQTRSGKYFLVKRRLFVDKSEKTGYNTCKSNKSRGLRNTAKAKAQRHGCILRSLKKSGFLLPHRKKKRGIQYKYQRDKQERNGGKSVWLKNFR